MGYIGNEAQTAFTSFDKQTITGTGTAVYTLSHNVANEQEIEVFVNNVRQEGGSGKAYTVSGNQITFTENIASTDTVYVNFQGKAVQTVSHPSDQPLQATTGTFSSNVDVGGSLLADTIKDGAGTNTAMTIDSTGRILMPQRPLFKAGKTSQQTAASVGTIEPIDWDVEIFDVGSNWDNTEFTAPVAGLYYFFFTILTPNDTNEHNFQIRQDSGSGMSPQLYARNSTGSSPNAHETVSGSTILNLSVGHKVDFGFDRNVYGDGSTYWSSCGGYLLG